MRIYNQNGYGSLWVKNIKDNEQEAKELVESLEDAIQPENLDDQWLGGYNIGDFNLDEMYVDKGSGKSSLSITGEIDGVTVALSIPIRDTESMRKIAKDIQNEIGIDINSSGLFIEKNDFREKRTKTADGQGRVNLGKDYSRQDVEVIILE